MTLTFWGLGLSCHASPQAGKDWEQKKDLIETFKLPKSPLPRVPYF